jgi:hypothetical protein
MRLRLTCVVLALLFALPALAQSDKPTPSSEVSKTLQDILSRSLYDVPSGSVSVSITFASTGELLFLKSMLAKMSLTPTQETQFRNYAANLIQMVETVYKANSLPKQDVGVAFGGLLEMCYELNTGTFKPGTDTPTSKQRTLAAIRQMQRALGSTPAFKSLSDPEKQVAYETGTFLIGHLIVTWQQAGKDETKQSALRDLARQQILGLFHVAPDSLSRRDTGAFVAKASRGGAAVKSPAVSAGNQKQPSSSSTTVPARSGPLPSANLGGAQVYIKYTLTYYPAATTNFEPLLLYPDGTAFDDLPDKPVSRFDEETLRKAVASRHVGTWKQQGDTIVLHFDGQKQPQRVLRRHPKGWFDGKGKEKPRGSYDIYFPVLPVSKQTLQGEWRNKELTSMGTVGGAVPMVAAGSSGRLLFRPDGTFTTSADRFASATTGNVGEAYKAGGDVGVLSKKQTGGGGQWRLDGLLLTLDQDGKRMVRLLFALPNWGKKGEAPDLLLDGQRWERPAKN